MSLKMLLIFENIRKFRKAKYRIEILQYNFLERSKQLTEFFPHKNQLATHNTLQSRADLRVAQTLPLNASRRPHMRQIRRN